MPDVSAASSSATIMIGALTRAGLKLGRLWTSAGAKTAQWFSQRPTAHREFHKNKEDGETFTSEDEVR